MKRYRVCACFGRQVLLQEVVLFMPRHHGMCCSADVCWFRWNQINWYLCAQEVLFIGLDSKRVWRSCANGYLEIHSQNWLLEEARIYMEGENCTNGSVGSHIERQFLRIIQAIKRCATASFGCRQSICSIRLASSRFCWWLSSLIAPRNALR